MILFANKLWLLLIRFPFLGNVYVKSGYLAEQQDLAIYVIPLGNETNWKSSKLKK